ncbi:hypothetical protein [Cryptosporangium sp. NPDC051539]|uniref:hypothetical protein n=1 Tax=Cryptosporangium sp. NPDC051539 TaxID=3363962 RepID=UPI0037BBBDE1
MDPLHRRMLDVGFDAGDELGLVLAGGYAMQAHDLVDRPSKDVDFAYCEPIPMAVVVERLAAAYRARGFGVEVLQVTPRMARMEVRTPDGECEVDLLKEALQPPARSAFGPVVSLEDAVGLKVRGPPRSGGVPGRPTLPGLWARRRADRRDSAVGDAVAGRHRGPGGVRGEHRTGRALRLGPFDRDAYVNERERD